MNQKGVKSVYLIGPNYAAGKDMLAGVAATYKGKVVGEDLTKWPDQLDFSAELTKVRNAKPDARVRVLSGCGRRAVPRRSMRRPASRARFPLYTAFTIDAITLKLQKELALGVPGAQHWVNDLPNDANKKYVADFRAKYKATTRRSTARRAMMPPTSSTAPWWR